MNEETNSYEKKQDPDPDTKLRGMDLRIRIRIRTKISWIRNTGFFSLEKLKKGIVKFCPSPVMYFLF
jgi:hypothetical protein